MSYAVLWFYNRAALQGQYLSFMVCTQMVCYRYLFANCVYAPYGPFNNKWVQMAVGALIKPLLYAIAIGFCITGFLGRTDWMLL